MVGQFPICHSLPARHLLSSNSPSHADYLTSLLISEGRQCELTEQDDGYC